MSTDDPDREELEYLFRRYREHGDVAAVAELYDRTAVRLLTVATHTCRTPSEAEDAVQSTFLTALSHAQSWQPERPLMPWLLGILANRVRRQHRDAARRPDADRLRDDNAADPSQALCNDEFTRAVDEAIAGLPRLYQPVLVLRLKHGMEPADIAHALRRPPGTVRAQLSRGLEQLRSVLPSVFAGMLALSLSPTTGLAAMRAQTLEHAADVAARTSGSWRWLLGSRRTLAACMSASALVLTCVLLWPSPEAPSAPPATNAPFASSVVASLPPRGAPLPMSRDEAVVDAAPSKTAASLRIELHRSEQPVPGALVELELLGDSPNHFQRRVLDGYGERFECTSPYARTPHRYRQHLTDVTGAARFAALPPGHWLVHMPGDSGVIALAPGKDAVLRRSLHGSAVEIQGSVLDPLGQPLAGAWIWASSPQGGDVVERLLQTDTNGRFRTCVPRGAIVAARSPGLLAAAMRVNTNSGAAVLEFRCEPGGCSIAGVVTDTDGRPIHDATVQVGVDWDRLPRRPQPGNTDLIGVPASVHTDVDGRFALEGVASGLAILQVRAPGMATTPCEVELRPDAAASVRVELQAGATIRGVVVDERGSPAPCEQVRTTLVGGGLLRVVSDADGRYELSGLPAGEFQVIAGTGPLGFARTEVTVAPAELVEWNPALSVGARRITGRVLHADGGPARVTVVLQAPRQQARTAADGSFELELPDYVLDRRFTLHAYECRDVDGGSTALGFALGVRNGVAAGDSNVEIRLRNAPRTASVRGTLIVDDPKDQGRLILVGADPQDQVLVARAVATVGKPVGWNCSRLPAGRYRLLIETRQVACFELAEAQQLDVGQVIAGRHSPRRGPDGGAACVPFAFAFVPPEPNDLGQVLTAEVFDRAGTSVGWYLAYSDAGAWVLPVSLPPGDYRIDADDGNGLVASTSIAVADRGSASHAVRIPLRQR